MAQIDWPEVLGSLLSSGMTQPEIAKAAECGQSTVSGLLNKRTTEPRFSLGFRLLALARARAQHKDAATVLCEVERSASSAQAPNATPAADPSSGASS